MNIIVKPYGSSLCHCRPDTTWERENRDFYSPECVNEIGWTPVVFARVSKAGKCIGQKFVERYYDGVGCGMLMYLMYNECQLASGHPRLHNVQTPPSRGWHVTSCQSDIHPVMASVCADHSTILPMPLYNPVVLDDGKKVFEVQTEGQEAHSVILSEAKNLLENAICKASELTSLRIGDIVAVELDGLKPLASRQTGGLSVKGVFCENEIFNFQIIF